MLNEIEKLINNDEQFRYQMLSRLQSDVKYFLGNGNGNKNCLWGKDIRTHIEAMVAIYDSLPEAPEWCPYSLIFEYKKWMLGYHKTLTRPMKTSEFFEKIDNMLEYDRNRITAHKDHCHIERLANDCFNVGFSVCQRAVQNGYGLRISVIGDYGKGASSENIGLYTIDECTPVAVKELTSLGVDFMMKAEEYMREFADDFQWTGYRVVYAENPDDSGITLGFNEIRQRADALAAEFRKKHEGWKGVIKLINLENRKEVASY